MDKITNEDVKVFGRVVSISTENVVADASQVWDSSNSLMQNVINSRLLAFKRTAESNLTQVNNLTTSINALAEKLTWYQASEPTYHE